MKHVIKYIRYLKVVLHDGSFNEYQTPYTSKERSLDVQRLKDKGFVYDPSSHSWKCSYYDDRPIVQQTHYVRYYKLKYI